MDSVKAYYYYEGKRLVVGVDSVNAAVEFFVNMLDEDKGWPDSVERDGEVVLDEDHILGEVYAIRGKW